MTEEVGVACGTCGEPRDSRLAYAGVERTPCPNCGATNFKVYVSVSEVVRVATDSVQWEMKPGDQSIGWSRRWELMQEKLREVAAVQTTQCSAKEIHALAGELRAFFVLAYHLKDSLINASAEAGIAKSSIESAISSTAALALLADLANLDKHAELGRPPRSGSVPAFTSLSAASHESGWVLKVRISHGNNEVDGISAAMEAVEAWRQLLQSWALIA